MSDLIIKPGNRVRDINPTWPRCNQIGTVVSVQGDNIIWRSDSDMKLVTDPIKDMEKITHIKDLPMPPSRTKFAFRNSLRGATAAGMRWALKVFYLRENRFKVPKIEKRIK